MRRTDHLLRRAPPASRQRARRVAPMLPIAGDLARHVARKPYLQRTRSQRHIHEKPSPVGPTLGVELREPRGPRLRRAEELLAADLQSRDHESRGRPGRAAAAGALPRRRHDQRAHRRRGQAVRDRLRAGVARELESAVPVSGRRRLQRLGAPARRRRGRRGESGTGSWLCRRLDRHGAPERKEFRPQLRRRSASEHRLQPFRDRRRDRRREGDGRRVLRPARGVLVFRGLLDGRPRSDGHDAALPELFRRRRVRRSRDPRRLLGARQRVVARGVQRGRAERRERSAATASVVFRSGQEGRDRRSARCLRRRRRRARRHGVQPARV